MQKFQYLKCVRISGTGEDWLWYFILNDNQNCFAWEQDSGSSEGKMNTTPSCMFVVGTKELKAFSFCKENPEEDYIKKRRWIREA